MSPFIFYKKEMKLTTHTNIMTNLIFPYVKVSITHTLWCLHPILLQRGKTQLVIFSWFSTYGETAHLQKVFFFFSFYSQYLIFKPPMCVYIYIYINACMSNGGTNSLNLFSEQRSGNYFFKCFYFKIYYNNIFYILKIIFDIVYQNNLKI